MAVSYGDFESMAKFYLNLLATEDGFIPIFFQFVIEQTYGVASPETYREILSNHKSGNVRPLLALNKDELIGLMLIRFSDFFPEEKDADTEKDIQAGQQPCS